VAAGIVIVAGAHGRPYRVRTKDGKGGGPSSVAKRSDIELALKRLAPRVRPHELASIVDHAVDSPGLNTAIPETAAWLSLTAYVRHTFTDYDELLDQGYDQDSARHFVRDEMQQVLTEWGVRRRLTEQE
jgi:hypothetical protein